MYMVKSVVLLCALGVTGVSVADIYSNVAINGQRLTIQELRVLENQLGSRVIPGSYLYNANNQCWVNLTTGETGCLSGGASNREPVINHGPNTTYDPDGGCEGGSCVNIIW